MSEVSERREAMLLHGLEKTTDELLASRAREAKLVEALPADLDAGREWMRCAWRELNAIRARDGAPDGVSPEWWDTLTEALGALLADDRVPWMTGAARKLVEPYEAERDASRAREAKLVEALRDAREAVKYWSQNASAVAAMRHNLASDFAKIDAALAPYTPAEMPSDVHPQEG